MLNDKGFSRIMSVIIVIVIVILVGVVISISSTGDNDSIDLVDIIENEIMDNANELVKKIPEFVGLDISAGGYKVYGRLQDSEEIEVIVEEVVGKFNLITKLLNEASVLLMKDFWQDKEEGGRKLMSMQIDSGEVKEIFELPNNKVDDLARFITGAVYSSDGSVVAYTTDVFDLRAEDGAGKEGPEYVEIWEYNIAKDVHTLITQIDGGLYVGVDLIGYDTEQQNLIVYQYVGDGPGSSFGTTYFINLEDQSIDKDTLKIAIERFTKQDNGEAKVALPLGRPHLSPDAKYLAFLLPVGLYYGGESEVVTPVIIYNIVTHEFADLYQYGAYESKDVDQDSQEVYNIHWDNERLYIATNKQVLEYNLTTMKLRPLYEWSSRDQGRYSVLAVQEDGLIVTMGNDGIVIYVDLVEAIERELSDFQNFEYINIYYQ